jgi:anthranilate synthase/aminodeoxychorismate synthase-like glutamine amidotransferase
MILLIDNYDSFTFNLVQFLGDLGAETVVRRNDKISPAEALTLNPAGIVLSPGPCTPNEAGICLDLVHEAAKAKIPLLGVCLGHQAIGQAFGGRVIRAPQPVHGKTARIHHAGRNIFANLPDPFTATRYHSLIVERATLPDCLDISAWLDNGLIMGLAHKTLPIFGTQFHPESIATSHGHEILQNFLREAKVKEEVLF